MGTTLEQYAAQHPLPEPTAPGAGPEAGYYARLEDQRQARQLMDSIQAQLEQGTAPQYILYTAIKAIGLLTHDEAWTEAARGRLDSVYADLLQQSMLTDNNAIAAQRLEKMQADYTEKTRTQLQRNLNGCLRLERALREALQTIEAPADQ